jgi:hypothetical protein
MRWGKRGNRARKVELSEVAREIGGTLPGHHVRTNLPLPEDPSILCEHNVTTGSATHGRVMNWPDWVIGITGWVTWFGIGLYTWWFTNAPVIDFFIATIIWLLIFAFAVMGVPLIRVFGWNRRRT